MNYSISKIKGFSYIAVVLLLTAVASFAQSNTGTITGQVQDQNGAVVPNATVTVTNLGTNESRNVQTNNEGFYEAASLPTGMSPALVATASLRKAPAARSPSSSPPRAP